jgi:hypothetical protein
VRLKKRALEMQATWVPLVEQLDKTVLAPAFNLRQVGIRVYRFVTFIQRHKTDCRYEKNKQYAQCSKVLLIVNTRLTSISSALVWDPFYRGVSSGS